MAINLTTPTVRPPSSLDLDDDQQTGQYGATNLSDPTMGTPYQAAEGANRADAISDPFSQYAMNALDAPSRFDSGVVQQGIDLVNREMDFSKDRSMADLDEVVSSRGLTGSSVEGRMKGDLLAQLEIAKGQRLHDLTLEMARTYGQDRTAAGNLALQAGDFAGGLDERDINEARYMSEYDRLLGRDYEGDMMNRAGLDLQAGSLGLQERAQQLQMMGMSQDEAFRYAQMEQQQSQFEAGMQQSGSQFESSLDLQRQELEGTLGLSQQELMQRREQFDADLAARREQFSAQIGLSEQELMQQNQQFLASMGEERFQFLESLGFQRETQQFQEAQNALDRDLENRALDLQAQGMSADEAYRAAMWNLEQDQMSQQAQIANQQAGLSAEDIYLRAMAAGAFDDLTPEQLAEMQFDPDQVSASYVPYDPYQFGWDG